MADERDLPGGEAERRDLHIGEDLGQPGARQTEDNRKPNKSDAGAKDAPPMSAQDADIRPQPTRNAGDRKNLGEKGGQ